LGAAVEIIDLSKRYGSFDALKQVSLRVAPGEFVTLLGPSGSGKTTTLSAIAGFVEATTGSVLVDGRPIDHLPPEARNIGVVFQHYALFPHMTVAENVAFPLEMRAQPRARVAALVLDALKAVQMSGFAERYPSELSGGQQQRIALARALVFSPPVMLLDEPLGALDKKLREELQIELKRLHHGSNMTMIYVTHDQEEALLLSDRIAVMRNGRIEQLGAPEEIYARPCNRFVAAFVGESNFLEAEVLARASAETRLRTTGGLDCISQGPTFGAASGRVSLMVRPEHVRLGAEAAGMRNRFSARVEEAFFAGGTVKYRLALSPVDSIVAAARSTNGHRAPLRTGSEVPAGFEPEDVLVYAETERASEGEQP